MFFLNFRQARENFEQFRTTQTLHFRNIKWYESELKKTVVNSRAKSAECIHLNQISC